eukprot:3522285-Alexandrium_andersonii.AAC.1
MAAAGLLSVTRGNIDKLHEREEANTVLDLQKRPWKAQKVGGGLFTWNGDWCLRDKEACQAYQQCPDDDTWTVRAAQLNCYRRETYLFDK